MKDWDSKKAQEALETAQLYMNENSKKRMEPFANAINTATRIKKIREVGQKARKKRSINRMKRTMTQRGPR